MLFGIEHEQALIGRVELARIDHLNRNAALGFFIGARERRRLGLGTRAVRLALEYAFVVENLERVYAHVFTFNDAGRRLMLRAGFKEEGTLRSHEFHHGSARDVVVFGILKSEFEVDSPGSLAPSFETEHVQQCSSKITANTKPPRP